MRSVAMDVFAMPEVTLEGETYDCVILAVDRHSGYIVAVPWQEVQEGRQEGQTWSGSAGQDRR